MDGELAAQEWMNPVGRRKVQILEVKLVADLQDVLVGSARVAGWQPLLAHVDDVATEVFHHPESRDMSPAANEHGHNTRLGQLSLEHGPLVEHLVQLLRSVIDPLSPAFHLEEHGIALRDPAEIQVSSVVKGASRDFMA